MLKYLYTYVTAIIIAISLVSCSDDIEDADISEDTPAHTEQTTIVYFLGTSLKSGWFDVYNLPDIRAAVADGALGDNGRLLIFMPNISSSANLYEIYQSGSGYSTEAIYTYDTNASLDQDRMLDVITRSQEFAPANTYNLILSGHGTGWVLSTHTTLKSIDADYINWDNMGTGDLVTRYMGGSSDGYMDIEVLSETLEQSSTEFGYILFDMCLMSNIETLYELKDVCDNVIASPCEVMGDGFPYQTVLPALFCDNGMSVDYAEVCSAYYDYYCNHTYNPYGAVAWCKTSELDDLAVAMKSINDAGVESVSINDLQCYEALSTHVFCDLGDYVLNACADQTLSDEFFDILDRAFPAEGRYHTSQFVTTLNGTQFVDIDDDSYWGVSTSAPSVKYPEEWAETSWAKATAAEQ